MNTLSIIAANNTPTAWPDVIAMAVIFTFLIAMALVATLDKAAAALLADAQARAAIADPHEWTRMPQKRCHVSNWSPSTLRRKVPIKKVDGTTFYSLAAVRELLNK